MLVAAATLTESMLTFHSVLFTNLFGGANSNEGLGLFSLNFDFLYIGTRGFYLPLV